MMLGKRMGFVSFIATRSKLAGRHGLVSPHTLATQPDSLPRSSAGQMPLLVGLPEITLPFSP
ncbi:MAG: hypothetical protein JW395_2942 [Nitrospira sp.]|nr:hypothetical protein [Nitrospira sp.]